MSHKISGQIVESPRNQGVSGKRGPARYHVALCAPLLLTSEHSRAPGRPNRNPGGRKSVLRRRPPVGVGNLWAARGTGLTRRKRGRGRWVKGGLKIRWQERKGPMDIAAFRKPLRCLIYRRRRFPRAGLSAPSPCLTYPRTLSDAQNRSSAVTTRRVGEVRQRPGSRSGTRRGQRKESERAPPRLRLARASRRASPRAARHVVAKVAPEMAEVALEPMRARPARSARAARDHHFERRGLHRSARMRAGRIALPRRFL
jgi:hypothetical protein